MKGLVLKKVKGITVILSLLLIPLVECCTDGLNGCSTCNTSINQCTTCIGGYFNSSGYCYTCSSVCKTCSLYLDCTSCYDGSYWSSSILWCYACSSNCKTCSSSQSTCNSCYQGNYLNNYRCYSCNSNCTKCLSSSICQACVSNYFLNNGTCQLCGSQCSTNQVASNTNIIIAIAISSTVFIVIVVIIIIFGKRKCQQTDLQANPFPPSDLEANPFPASFYAMNVPVQPSMVIIQPIKWVRIDSQQFKKSCAICLGQGNCQIKCGHIFHPHCISEWLKRNIACPICRKEVDTYGIVVVCEKCFQFGFRSNLKDLIKAKPTDFRLLHKCM